MNLLTRYPQFQELAVTLHKQWRIVAGAAGGGAALALMYVLLASPKWQASQTLLVREEASGSTMRQGRFDNADAMKTAQETILELSKNPSVAEASLRQAGPAGASASVNWPASSDVESLRDAIKISAPRGASFGATEVLYLTISDSEPKRAIVLVAAVCNQLDKALREVRVKKGLSMTRELERTLALAQADLQKATHDLETVESAVGQDLPELRVLNESGAGEGNLRLQLNQIESEIRAARQAQDDVKKTREHLARVDADPNQINAVSTLVLERLPSIRRLKDGLLEAQLRTSELSGRMTDGHPKVVAAKKAEEAVRAELIREVKLGLQSSQADLEAYQARVASLQAQSQDVRNRFEQIAKLRAEYGNLTAAVKRRAEVVQKAEKDLSEARAMVEAAHSASLLTLIDAPVAGDRPAGPGKATILVAGLLGGFFLGFGIVLLMAPIGQTSLRRRFSDLIAAPFGRRAADRTGNGGDRRSGFAAALFGRRSSDASNPSRRAEGAIAAQGPPRRRSTDQLEMPAEPPRRRIEDSRTETVAAPRVYSEVS
jgi:succinoglycan biosynthesis transport protein ExoP